MLPRFPNAPAPSAVQPAVGANMPNNINTRIGQPFPIGTPWPTPPPFRLSTVHYTQALSTPHYATVANSGKYDLPTQGYYLLSDHGTTKQKRFTDGPEGLLSVARVNLLLRENWLELQKEAGYTGGPTASPRFGYNGMELFPDIVEELNKDRRLFEALSARAKLNTVTGALDRFTPLGVAVGNGTSPSETKNRQIAYSYWGPSHIMRYNKDKFVVRGTQLAFAVRRTPVPSAPGRISAGVGPVQFVPITFGASGIKNSRSAVVVEQDPFYMPGDDDLDDKPVIINVGVVTSVDVDAEQIDTLSICDGTKEAFAREMNQFPKLQIFMGPQ